MSDQWIKGKVRRSQLITTYGVGSIVALGDESFMPAGTDLWPVSTPDVHEPRLELQLGVIGFMLPPATGDGRQDVPAVRFPQIHFCPTCRVLQEHKRFTGYLGNTCNQCDAPLVPSRFVVACNNGHIDDFPYFRWVHAEHHDRSKPHTMMIGALGASASLSDVEITCSCGEHKTMQGAFSRTALQRLGGCSGRRPWLGDAVACGEVPRTLQRGASNVWFPVVSSALSIPPWSEGAYKHLNRHWEVLRHLPEDGVKAFIEGAGIAKNTPYTTADMIDAWRGRLRREREPQQRRESAWALRPAEYEALVRGMLELSGEQDFVCVPSAETAPEVSEWFEHVAEVKRLREVRVLQSFTRLNPPSAADGPERRARLSASDEIRWLPAIEVQGEGLFLQLNGERLREWERRAEVHERAALINVNYGARFTGMESEPDRQVTPRLLMIHTLAHALITQLALEVGYPAAALRERLYVSEEMAGVLIYTATTDSAGSLGGITAQARPAALRECFLNAIRGTAWCSADPLCIESDPNGVDSLNLAACHACVLLPEVSCEEANLLLDRAMLVGTPENPALGFFGEVLL